MESRKCSPDDWSNWYAYVKILGFYDHLSAGFDDILLTSFFSW